MFCQLSRSVRRIPVGVRNIAGLPKYDEAANISLKQLWPAIVIIAGKNVTIITSVSTLYSGFYGVGMYINPFRSMDMDHNKWTK